MTDKKLTVEECLAELREMFGNTAVSISHFETWSLIAPHRSNWSVSILQYRFSSSLLSDAMDQARAYRDSQQ